MSEGGRKRSTIRTTEQAKLVATGNGRRQKAARLGLPPPLTPRECEDLCRSASREAIDALRAALKRPGERVHAAKALLDRGFGAATQRLEHGGAPDGSPILAVLSMTEEQRMVRLRELLAKMRRPQAAAAPAPSAGAEGCSP